MRHSSPIYISYVMISYASYLLFFFFNDTATTEIYTHSLHDALPICTATDRLDMTAMARVLFRPSLRSASADRKSTRLNSSHTVISYAVFCLKKKTTEDAVIDRNKLYTTQTS